MKIKSAVAAVQHLELAIAGAMTYKDWASFEADVHDVWAFLEVLNDELKPELEERARRSDNAD